MASNSPLPAALRLDGKRVLVVQCRPSQAVALGAAVVRAGGQVTVARTRSSAIQEIERAGAFDAAVVDTSLPGDGLSAVVQMLRGGERPCLAVGLCAGGAAAERRRAVWGGVIDLIVPPLDADTFIVALLRCANATALLRARLDGETAPKEEPVPQPPPRRAPHAIEPGVRALVDPSRARRGDLEGRVQAFANGRGLSTREVSVLRFVAMGYRYDEIAEAMAISPRTVKMHVLNLRRKVGASNRYQLLRKMYAAA